MSDRTERDEQILELVLDAVYEDGSHHKQWCLVAIAKLLMTPEEYQARVNDDGWWDEGIAP